MSNGTFTAIFTAFIVLFILRVGFAAATRRHRSSARNVDPYGVFGPEDQQDQRRDHHGGAQHGHGGGASHGHGGHMGGGHMSGGHMGGGHMSGGHMGGGDMGGGGGHHG